MPSAPFTAVVKLYTQPKDLLCRLTWLKGTISRVWVKIMKKIPNVKIFFHIRVICPWLRVIIYKCGYLCINYWFNFFLNFCCQLYISYSLTNKDILKINFHKKSWDLIKGSESTCCKSLFSRTYRGVIFEEEKIRNLSLLCQIVTGPKFPMFTWTCCFLTWRRASRTFLLFP